MSDFFIHLEGVIAGFTPETWAWIGVVLFFFFITE